jgi:branched-chain amino acid transport system ATP-binding protein
VQKPQLRGGGQSQEVLAATAPAAGGELRAEKVTVSRGGVVALSGASFRLSRGEAVGMIGPNGAGKTTLLDALSGFLKPQGGRVLLDGEDITKFPAARLARRGVYRTFQGSRLFTSLSVEENIEVSALAAGATHRTAVARTQDLMKQLDLIPFRGRRCRELPQGFTQRIVLARALATKSRFVLLDEPAAGLSDLEAVEFHGLVRRARDEGAGLLVVEHHMAFVEAVCDRVCVMVQGEFVFDGSVQETFSSPLVQAAYLGVANEGAE